MSQVNLLGNQAWPDATINAAITALIRQTYSADDELKAARLARKAAPTEADLAFVAAVDACIADALAQGELLRSDAKLLDSVLEYESAVAWLEKPVEPEFIDCHVDEVTTQEPNPLYAQDVANRAAAQAVLDGASDDTKDLFALRYPPAPAPEPVIEEPVNDPAPAP